MEILNKLADYNWDMKPVNRRVSTRLLKAYLRDKDSRDQEIIKDIIEQTRYISFQELKEKLNLAIDKLLSKYKLFNLYFSTKDKIGSEHWLTVLIWSRIKENCIKVIDNYEDIDNDLPIVAIDDCIYSGCHMCSIVDALQYDYKYNFGVPLKNRFVITVPFSSKIGVRQLKTSFGCKIIAAEYIDHYQQSDPDYMYKRFGCETEMCLPIYFDHKIANEFGSFPAIYKNIILKQPSRNKIEKLERLKS